MLKSRKTYLPLILCTTLLLQSCTGLIIGAGVGAASVAHDRRTIGTQVDDTTAAGRISTAMLQDPPIHEQTNISVQVFNGTALLVGQAPTNKLIQRAAKLASSVKNIKKLHRSLQTIEIMQQHTKKAQTNQQNLKRLNNHKN